MTHAHKPYLVGRYPACLTLRKIRQERGMSLFQVAIATAIEQLKDAEGKLPETYEELTTKVGQTRMLDVVAYSKFENGVVMPGPAIRKRVAKALGLSEIEVFPELLSAEQSQ